MDTGLKVYRNYFNIPFGWTCDCKYGIAYPCFRKLMYPGDVFKIHADLLIRYQPMFTPPMNNCVATVRFGFVPLRLIEELTELIITGSKEGKLYEQALPTFDSVFKYLNISSTNTVQKYSLLDTLYNIPAGLTLTNDLKTALEKDKASPAAYFAKAFLRFWWDYYRDENLNSRNDFEQYWQAKRVDLHKESVNVSVALKKDRVTSALPWQLKAVSAPRIEMLGGLPPWIDQFWAHQAVSVDTSDILANGTPDTSTAFEPFAITGSDTYQKFNTEMNKTILAGLGNLTHSGFTAAQLREQLAQTRIYERLARCGSRYTEYLRANFNVAPSDGTLQRAQYLGGFKTRIVTTEVVQTAADGDNPVGTLRGHGITHGTAIIKPFMAKEIGIIIGILDVKPETIYAQGVDRELTCRSRFDFFNPSLQHLSEQEVRKGEIYFGTDDDSGVLENGKTWGFQPYGQEYRTGIKHICGDFRDGLSAWTQALIFSERPQLNLAFIQAANHQASYNRPFVVNDPSIAYPLLVDFGGSIEAYRPLIKNGTPGLMDHN